MQRLEKYGAWPAWPAWPEWRARWARRAWPLLFLALAACQTLRPVAPLPKVWDRRVNELQHAAVWQLDGRAAVAVATQGWQSSLTWSQHDATSVVRLAGPLGVGAVVLTKTPAGLSVNNGPPGADALAQLQTRLGFALPLDELRYWLLGVPAPGQPFDLERNAQDRAQTLVQNGWNISYDRYLPVAADLLPAHLVLSRNDVRVRIVVDHWNPP